MDRQEKNEIVETISRRLDQASRESKIPKVGVWALGLTVLLHGVGMVAFLSTLVARVDILEKREAEDRQEIKNRTPIIYTVQHLESSLRGLRADIKEIKLEMRKLRQKGERDGSRR